MAATSFHYADVNGVRLHYARAGEGRLILFLHGFPEFWYAWKNQLSAFGRDYLAVAPDLRGYNLSSKPRDVDDYQLKHIVEDVRGLADHLEYERLVLVGHDWGGVAAWLFAAQYPQRMEKLVVINAPHPGVFERELRENPAQRQASQYIPLLCSEDAEQFLSAGNYALLEETVLRPGLARGYFTEEDRRAYLEAWSQPGALTGALNYYRAARLNSPGNGMERQLAAQVPSLHVETPTLVIWGEKDVFLLTGNLTGLGPYVPNLQLRLMGDCTHWVVHEEPALVNGYIRGFIE